MQPITISIQGNYIDCQIYCGKLYLWTLEGSLKVVNWGKLVRALDYYTKDRLTMRASFMESYYMYDKSIQFLLRDKIYKDLMLKRFNKALGKVFTITEEGLTPFVLSEQDVLTGELPIDTEIFDSCLYMSQDDGIYSAQVVRTMNPVDKKSVYPNTEKHWDGRAVSIKANDYPQIALSCADEGLWELDLINDFREPLQLTQSHSLFANYTTNGNVYNSTSMGICGMAQFEFNSRNQRSRSKRTFTNNIIGVRNIFRNDNSNTLSWGAYDKIYKVVNEGFEVVKYNPRAKSDEEPKLFRRMQRFNHRIESERVVSAGSALFGNIIEYDNRLEVVGNKAGELFTIDGPITRWRVYPRSKNYLNHLHVILDDSVNIYSFGNDYFQDQEKKRVGTMYSYRRYGNSKIKDREYVVRDADDDEQLPF